MLFSKHNENITYINHYSGLLEVKGKGVLSLEDTELLYEQGKNWAKEYDTLSVTEGITGLGEGYIEFFSHIDCLILSRTVGTLAASPELLKGWRKRKVLICGEYDGMVFIVGPERMSKCRFIIKSLAVRNIPEGIVLVHICPGTFRHLPQCIIHIVVITGA